MRSPIKEMKMPGAEGMFGAVRKHDIHTGVDLYADVGTKVTAMESGTVVAIVPFTGIMAESPWWHDTKAIMVEGDSGVILYGEINPADNLHIGDFVFEGDFLGTVLRVLKKDKGKPVAMLHLECYSPGTKEPVWWNLNESKPENLLDPTPLIQACSK
jgi:murein DD-endopeptidase MepM/ murein hydrolase activator NlpD